MAQPKLLSLLHTLSPWELQRLSKFVRSPYFTADPKHSQLLETVLALPQKHSLDREALHRQLYPEMPYVYTRITNLLSDLTRLVEEFLAVEHMRKDPLALRLPLLVEAGERNADKWFHSISREIGANISPIEQLDEQGLYHLFQLEVRRNTFFISREQRKSDQSLPNSILALDRFYVVAMLKSICQLLNRRNVISEENRQVQQIQEDFLTYMQLHHHRYTAFPLIQGYYLILMTLTEAQNAEHFRTLTIFLQQEQIVLPNAERKTMYQYAQNYCIKQINRGQQIYLSSLFDLYREMIQQDLIYYQGYISPSDVKNIVSLGIRLREFSWTEQFLDEFEEKIAEEYRGNSMSYNRAYLYYGQGKRREALRLLSQVEFQDVFYYLGAKTLLLKIYYELEDQEGLDALLHAFEATLRRHKLISAYRKKPYLNLIRFTKKLTALRFKVITHSPKAYQQAHLRLSEQIQATKEIVNIDWLEEKLREIEGR